MQDPKPQIIIICGPTATGKSDLAVDIALHIEKELGKKAEIISADSRQVYKGLDIGTGKITQEEMRGVPHHMIDIAEPIGPAPADGSAAPDDDSDASPYSVADFKRDADAAIADIHARGGIPIICGGTGQYIDAVVFNQSLPDVEPDEALRAELEPKSADELLAIFDDLNKDEHGNAQLHSVDLQNKRRVIRAIEILKELGHIPPITREERFDALWIGLDADDETLKSRIAMRLDSRLEAGMIEESTRLLRESKLTLDRMRKLGLEYAHIADLLAKEDLDEASMTEFKSLLSLAIWHYAKRQRTWFRRNAAIHWLISNDPEGREKAFAWTNAFLDR